ncbi:MAG: YihY/virulence factor BrkB family protein [Flavisolibacter sp.]|nr:YihY/virulence factor BrkB family protein [Flavisolibacter sp.]
MAFRFTIRKHFESSRAGKEIIHRTRKTFIPGFSGFSLYEVATEFIYQLRKTSLVERASGISFNIVMAIPPTLIFIFTLVPYFPISKEFLNQMFALIRDVVPGEKNNSVIIDFLKDFVNRPRNELLSFGLFLAIFFSSNAMMGVLRSFDKDYPGFEKRKGLHKRRIALQLTMLVFFLIFLCLLLLIAQANVLRWLGVESEFWRNLIHNSRWIVIILLTYFIVSFIYRHGPAVAKRWPLFSAGAVFATTLMVVATALFSYWVNNFSNYNTVYGSIGAVFILMSLIYTNSLAILMGFELNVTLTQLRRKKEAAPVNKVN